MNKMLLAGSAGIVLLSAAASPVWADDNASTFSLGYAQSHTNHAGTLRGVRLANNYEMSPDWGLTTSFAWLNGSQRYSYESSNGRVTTRYYSLLAGPSWKINNQLSLYSQVGPVLLHQRDHGINESDSKVGYGYSAGVAYTPVSNVAITLGYEGADFDATHNSGSLNSNGFNLGVGYRF
ncbi:STM3031 family outer membrane protein [Salmonella sp. 32070601201500089SM]|uniref:STM3031 family outer membrane protein n=1 Tax=Salmonella sp. 32070601201500089SM TaxID=2819686 RepID=UPI00132359E8|nr:STM3031 family outer membrane protein [Salmonella sp. 32070601201500089SM]ECW3357131.1 porin family protein [Salmonella enterica subsp. enterica serovar Lagos]EHW4289557.1 porin family protein [Salmonella enterica subsp. enterica serovar Lagos]MBO2435105.1 porin family protein [Salmonella sp. 32070601201500089SM]